MRSPAWLVELAAALLGSAAIVAECGSCGGGGSSHGAASDGGGGGSGAGSGATCSAAPADESGNGTYYNADGTGACSFDASTDYMVAAMNETDYGTAAWCGACLAVTGPMGTITIRVVDECPGCAKGGLDLSETAFGMLAPLAQGVIPITWHEVPCAVTGPIQYEFQSGTSQYYAAIQIRNATYPIATVEAKQGSGYTPLAKQSYNYYVASSGLGPGPYDLRVTDARGEVVEDTGVALLGSGGESGSGQFAVCSGD